MQPTPKQVPFNWDYMLAHEGLKGWWGMPTLFEVKVGYHPNEKGFLDNNQLNHAGLQVLQQALLSNPTYKNAICNLPSGKLLGDKLKVVCKQTAIKDEL